MDGGSTARLKYTALSPEIPLSLFSDSWSREIVLLPWPVQGRSQSQSAPALLCPLPEQRRLHNVLLQIALLEPRGRVLRRWVSRTADHSMWSGHGCLGCPEQLSFWAPPCVALTSTSWPPSLLRHCPRASGPHPGGANSRTPLLLQSLGSISPEGCFLL